MSKLRELAEFYKIPTLATPEDLEGQWGKVITYGDIVILVGHYYHNDGNCYFVAVYEFLDDEDTHTCEDFIGIRTVSEHRFVDDGHAIEWALKQN